MPSRLAALLLVAQLACSPFVYNSPTRGSSCEKGASAFVMDAVLADFATGAAVVSAVESDGASGEAPVIFTTLAVGLAASSVYGYFARKRCIESTRAEVARN